MSWEPALAWEPASALSANAAMCKGLFWTGIICTHNPGFQLYLSPLENNMPRCIFHQIKALWIWGETVLQVSFGRKFLISLINKFFSMNFQTKWRKVSKGAWQAALYHNPHTDYSKSFLAPQNPPIFATLPQAFPKRDAIARLLLPDKVFPRR